MTILERTLAKALTEIVIRLDLSDDDAIAPEATMEVLQPVIALLQGLPDDDRRALVELIGECVKEEVYPDRRLTAWEVPETLGLLS